MKKICAVIPALNEAAHIGAVIEKVRASGLCVIVVDDGSTDGTSNIAARSAHTILSHPMTRGKGAALKTGLAFAVGEGYDAIVTLDGDAQHDPSEIPMLLDEFYRTGCGIMVANRMHDPKGMPILRRLVNILGSKAVSLFCSQRIPDAFTGYKVISREVLESITPGSDGYEYDPEMLIRAKHAGHKIGHIDALCIYGTQKSRIRVLPDGYRLIRMFFRIIFDKGKR